MAKYTLADVKGMSDAELGALFGFPDKIKTFKDHIAEADKLPPKGKKVVEDRLNSMLNPTIYPDEIRWAIDDAKRKDRTGKDELCCCEPASVVD